MSEPEAVEAVRGRSTPRRSRAAASLLAAVYVALALAACAPSARDVSRPLVAVMNAPAQSTVRGAAERVQDVLVADGDLPFDLVSAFTMRFLESHTDLFHSRAAPSAARIARDQGADLAVMVGAPVLERQVTPSRDEASRRIDVAVALEAQVVDPQTEAIVQTLRPRTDQGSRVAAKGAQAVEAAERPPSPPLPAAPAP